MNSMMDARGSRFRGLRCLNSTMVQGHVSGYVRGAGWSGRGMHCNRR